MLTTRDRARTVAQIEDLKRLHVAEMRSKVVATPAAAKIQRKINELQTQLDRDEHEAIVRAKMARISLDETLNIVAIPLMADVLNAVIADVEGMLRQNKLSETVFGDLARNIRRDAMRMVDTLAVADTGLPDLLEVDDHLVEAVHKKIMSFIKQRLNITK